MNTITLIPAYGRDYHSRAKVLEDWEANKDFIIADISHPYSDKPVNRSEIVSREPNVSVRIRYYGQQRIALVEC